jgi:hypothetical protein
LLELKVLGLGSVVTKICNVPLKITGTVILQVASQMHTKSPKFSVRLKRKYSAMGPNQDLFSNITQVNAHVIIREVPYIFLQVGEDFLGVGFSGLRGLHLFPVASAVWGHCQASHLVWFLYLR